MTAFSFSTKGCAVSDPKRVQHQSPAGGYGVARSDYAIFYKKLKVILPVLDITVLFHAEADSSFLYIDGKLDPYSSSKGNKIIAEEIVANIIETPINLEAIT